MVGLCEMVYGFVVYGVTVLAINSNDKLLNIKPSSPCITAFRLVAAQVVSSAPDLSK